MEKTITEKVHEIIQEHLGIEQDRIIPDAKIYEDLGADSLDCVELVMAFEEEFSFEITDDEAEKCETVQGIITLISKKKGTL